MQQTTPEDQKGTVSKLGNFFARLLRFLIGEIHWSAPLWLLWLVAPLRKLLEFRRREPKRFRLALLATTLSLALLSGGYYWYSTRPKPVTISVTAEVPPPLRLIKDAIPEPLVLRFSKSAAPIELVGQPVTTGVTMRPPLAGSWQWRTDTELVFTPEAKPLSPENVNEANYWPAGQTYRVEFEKAAFPPHVLLARYELEFKTAPFTAQLRESSFYQDPANPSIKKAVATVRFSHPVDKSSLQKLVRVLYNERADRENDSGSPSREIPFLLSYDAYSGEAYIHSDNLTSGRHEAEVIIEVAKGVKAARLGAATPAAVKDSVTVPSLYDYLKVNSVALSFVKNDKFETERVIHIETNLEVSQQELKKHFRVVVLPVDRPAFQGKSEVKNYHWYDTTDIGPEVLQLAEHQPVEWIPSEREYASRHSFRFAAETGRFLYVEIGSGLVSFGGYILAKDYPRVIRITSLPSEITIMSDGALLSLSGKRTISVLTRDVEHIQFEVSRLQSGSVHHLLAATGGDFKNPRFNFWNFDTDNIGERFTEERQLPQVGEGKVQYNAFDFSSLLNSATEKPRGLFYFKVHKWDPVRKQPLGVSDTRLILVTDLGLLVKKSAAGVHDVFVQRIDSGLPAENVEVSVLGVNGLPLFTEQTGADGHVQFPNLDAFKREKEPIAYIAHIEGDYSFLPYERRDRELNISRFDVGGITTATDPGTLRADLFTSRGLYRPGDELQFAAIVKPEDWSVGIAGIPLEMALQDARGLTIKEWKYQLTPEGFSDFKYQLLESAPTGVYHAQLYLIKNGWRDRLLGSTSLRVEEFLPDQLKIRGNFSKPKTEGWVSPDDLKFIVHLENLFGTPAQGNRVSLSISLSPTRVAFRKFKGYTFTDPLLADKSYHEQIGDLKTDELGRAEFALPLEKFESKSYLLGAAVEGFEDGSGRSVSAYDSLLISPLATLVGAKADGRLAFISRHSSRSLHYIAVDNALNQTALTGLKLQLIRHRYVSVLKKQPNSTFAYESVPKEEEVSSEDFAIAAEGTSVQLPTAEPGNFSYLVKDNAGLVLAKTHFTVAGDANLQKNLDKNAELDLSLDKEDYAPGEEIKLQITAPYVGAGLITIERDRVYAHKWFKTDTTGTAQSIVLPDGVEGNAYVSVSFVRSLQSDAIFQSPLSYAVKPFSISRARRTNPIELTIPEMVKPGERLDIEYRAKRPAKAVVFAVDEGILLAAAYRNPNPLAAFFQKKALQVDTRQILDLILPEFSAEQLASAPGGGEGQLLGKNLNPFKRKKKQPVVFWSGIVDIGPEAKTISYQVPDYFSGGIRILAVAVSEQDIGTAVANTIVRGDFVISPHVPLFVAPGDEFVLSATVANTAAGSGPDAKVEFAVASNAYLQLPDEKQQTLAIGEGREETVKFKVKANDLLGAAELVFSARLAGSETVSARLTESLSVRPASPYRTLLSSGHFRSGTEDVDIKREMYPAYRDRKAALSPVPLSLAGGLRAYLQAYPYACTEQLVSQAFATIVLERRPEFSIKRERATTEFFKIQTVLRARQNAQGAFGFWAANSHVSEFQAVYATHFLTDAREFGYPVQEDLLKNALNYLSMIAGHEKGVRADEQVRAYAIYILTRNGIVTSNYIDDLRKDLTQTGNSKWQKELTSAYLAAAYKLMHSEDEARKLIALTDINEQVVADYSRYYDKLVHSSHYLYLLAKHFPERLSDVSAEDIIKLTEPITWGLYNTISSASTILALEAYATAAGPPAANGGAIAELHADGSAHPLGTSGNLILTGILSEHAKKLRFSSSADSVMFYQLTETGFDTRLPEAAVTDGLEVTRRYFTAEGEPLVEAKLGERIKVQIIVRALGEVPLSDVAVIDILPSGFEIDVKRGASTGRQSLGGASYTWAPQYVDIREDRILLFGTVDEKVREFTYELVPISEGNFVVPPIYAESMYNRSVQGLSLGGRLRVSAGAEQ